MRILVWAAASVLIVLGLLTVLLPLPTGVPLLALGFVLILATSRAATRWLRGHRRHRARLDHAFTWLETRAPKGVANVLRRTRPRRKPRLPGPELPPRPSGEPGS
ncbi:hypothetical protein [Stappia sp.]|uniref:hypothetical protein n=1 Tax=Stappia sp. TaxID=1870903 RepID=UPI0032D99756